MFEDDSLEFDDEHHGTIQLNDKMSFNAITNNIGGDVCTVFELDFEYF